ncbi:MAG: serine/threonine protein kinase, partial [Phycisphaerae bacterium]|nr:serine/threonine protein kinase [Gemmatimonadaceae bacterium]
MGALVQSPFSCGTHIPTNDIAQDDWPAVKSLWFAVQDAEPGARAALLDDPAVDPGVRRHVERLLAASESVGDRFETPAISGLGGQYLPPENTAPSLIGRRLGPYDVVRRIGQGGMGAVYEAVRADHAFDQRVAIKTIWRGADSTVLLQRFRSERQILAGLQHPNIAALVDGGATEEGTPWLAMEYVDGVPIDEYCDIQSLGLPARLDLFRQVCAAVNFAHRNFVVHRDLKPTNVLVTTDGTVKLLDFGVAKLMDDPRGEGTLTSAGLSPFTASYAAPEQVTGAAISTATDVYSLGALLSMLVAGEPPLDSAAMSPGELMDAIRDRPALAPSEIVARVATRDEGHGLVLARARGFQNAARLARALEGELDAITLMALRKEPERRYAGADALADDVRRYLRRDRVHARPDTLGYRLRSLVRRQRPLALASAAGLLVLVVSIGTVTWQQRMRANEQVRAEQRLREVRTLVSALVNDANDQLADIPGATQARANLVRTALRALDRASVDAPRDSTLLRELAMAYSRVGDVLGNPTQANLGDLNGAASAYVKAIGIAEGLMQHYPNDPNSAWTLALVYEKAADVEAPVGQLPQALAHQRASLALFRNISAADTLRYGAIRAVGISA